MFRGPKNAQKVRKYWRITPINLDSHSRLPGPVRPSPIDAFEQHRQLSTGQRYLAAVGLRPYKSSPLQPLRKQTKAITVEPKQLDQIAASATERKHVTGERSLFEGRLYQAAKPGEAAPHIGHARRNPDLRVRRRRDHASRHPNTVRSVPASTAPAMRTCCPRVNVNSIEPSEEQLRVRWSGLHSRTTCCGCSASTVTGNKQTRGVLRFSGSKGLHSSCPAAYSLRQ